MNIYITPKNEQRLRMWRNMGPGRSMSGLINELLSTRFGDPDFRPTDQEEQIVAEDDPFKAGAPEQIIDAETEDY